MRTKKNTGKALLSSLSAWEILAAGDEFAGYTLGQYKALVEASFEARRKEELNGVERDRCLVASRLADEASWEAYLKVIHGIRAHPKHGGNSALLRTLGYITDMERESGLTRPESLPDPTVTPSTPEPPVSGNMAA